MTILHLRKSIDRSPLQRSFRFGALALALACCALPPVSRAFLPPPPPDGGYPGFNTAEGDFALFNLTSGTENTAIGFGALVINTTGSFNTANGVEALRNNTTGFNNTANGVDALRNNTTGFNNTANGLNALSGNSTGANNTAIGAFALANNTASRNIALGRNAGRSLTTGSDNIDIGNAGVMGESTTIRIGVQGTQTRTFVAGISGSPIAGTSVVVSGVGRLGTVASSQRFKDDIKPMDKASEAILALKPVTFRYKQDVDPDSVPQFGLVAEEVEKVNPDLVVRDKEGKPYTVRYEAVNAMLLNEFLKARRQIDAQQKQIDALTAGLQKVSAQLEASNPAPQVVNNP
jgi:hypothetical protein